jgi:hypothetical protein
VSPPTLAASFAPESISLNGIAFLTFTITNPSANTEPELGVAFSDALPSGLVVATPNDLLNSCGGTATATAGSFLVSLSGGAVPANGSCTVSLVVQGTSRGLRNNVSGAVSSTNGGTGNSASASIAVGQPTIITSFGAASIPLHGVASLTFAINNTDPSTGVGFSDTLPAGLVLATPNGLRGSCGGGTVAAGSGSNVISLSGATLEAFASCSFSVNVTGATAGVQANRTGPLSSNEGGVGRPSNSATITVVAPPTIATSFGTASILLGGLTTLDFTIVNPNAATALTGVAFPDTFPAGLVVAAPNGLTGSCGAGAITANAASRSVGLSGTTLRAGSSCSFALNVTGTSPGVKANTTGNITSNEGGTGAGASANLVVTPAPGSAAPMISSARLSRSAFRASDHGASLTRHAKGHRTGTDVRYGDSEAALTTFAVLARTVGHKHGKRCLPGRARKRRRRCMRLASVGSFIHEDRAGSVSVHFTGRIHGRKLTPGRYRLALTPHSAGQTGPTVSLRFRIIR